MTVTKRSGATEPYTGAKIDAAIRAAFKSSGNTDTDSLVPAVFAAVEERLEGLSRKGTNLAIELIQDIVEQELVAHNCYAAAKSYILYREERHRLRSIRHELIEALFPEKAPGDPHERLEVLLCEVQDDFREPEYALEPLLHKFIAFKKERMTTIEALAALTQAALELTSQEAPNWEFIASRLLMMKFTYNLNLLLHERGIGSFHDKLRYLTQEGLYGSYILDAYSPEDIAYLETRLDSSRDKLFTYSALDLLLRRYVIRSTKHEVLETPQELFMGIAMHLAMNEKTDRRQWVLRFYDILSTLKITVATPTLSNARKPHHQLSSCFIDTVPDSLDGIYRSITNFAQVSKFGGGMGLYFGKVRAVGSPIRGFQGVAGGVLRWIKLANDTAIAVDQLGVRQGSVAVYLDAWHKDLPEFLQLKTNNGDDRMKAHDVFPAVCYPDLFWKMAKDSIDAPWYLMCPHEIRCVRGYALEDSFGDEWEERYHECVADERISKREISVKELVRLIIKSAVETGTPFVFNRDTVNRMNPNPHKGMIYCSNLCTEIAQNMSGIELLSREIKTDTGDTVVVETTRPGDFVVCNLASLVLGAIDVEQEGILEETVKTAVRALDNIIDLNFYPIEYARITNRRYRAIGLGVSGYHHLLAKHRIKWESPEHLSFVDAVMERINYAAIEASNALAREKGAYEYFEGSDWHSGEYFKKRGYSNDSWQALARRVADSGVRNGYLLAIAPTSSTSIVAGTSAGTDPIMKKYWLEEKRGMIVPRVAPGLSAGTRWYYTGAHQLDQSQVIRAAAVRQKHIDQSQSVNLFITTEYSLRQVLDLYILAWEAGLKTVYYVRSQSLEVESCDSCSA